MANPDNYRGNKLTTLYSIPNRVNIRNRGVVISD